MTAVPLSPRLDAAWRAAVSRRLAEVPVHALPDAGLKRAAVALPLVEAGFGADIPGMPALATWSDEAALLLTRRPEHMGRHAGQWAWPGGRADPGESAEETALRELREEVGLSLSPLDVLGRLDDYATRSGFVITPVLVWAGAARELQADPREVASVHRLPVSELLRADAPMLDHEHDAEHPVLRMPVGEHWIAAPTAAMLYQFREWFLRGRETRVAHFEQPRFAWR